MSKFKSLHTTSSCLLIPCCTCLYFDSLGRIQTDPVYPCDLIYPCLFQFRRNVVYESRYTCWHRSIYQPSTLPFQSVNCGKREERVNIIIKRRPVCVMQAAYNNKTIKYIWSCVIDKNSGSKKNRLNMGISPTLCADITLAKVIFFSTEYILTYVKFKYISNNDETMFSLENYIYMKNNSFYCILYVFILYLYVVYNNTY